MKCSGWFKTADRCENLVRSSMYLHWTLQSSIRCLMSPAAAPLLGMNLGAKTAAEWPVALSENGFPFIHSSGNGSREMGENVRHHKVSH